MKNKNLEGLKRKAERYYILYYKEADKYDCGLSLAENISPTMVQYKTAFNEIMDELAKIDPSAPDFRL